jgi:hypothetical protein
MEYGAHYFNTMDMYKDYHQVRVKECDIHKKTFRTHYGLFEYCVLPFGLCNAPAGFQATMNLVKYCVVYLDDVLIYNQTADEHLEHIRHVLRELHRHQLHIKLLRCYFGRSSVNFMGHVMEVGRIRMDPDKVEALQNWP